MNRKINLKKLQKYDIQKRKNQFFRRKMNFD